MPSSMELHGAVLKSKEGRGASDGVAICAVLVTDMADAADHCDRP
jgi:hypothetical protein